jgi:hypothetical protein
MSSLTTATTHSVLPQQPYRPAPLRERPPTREDRRLWAEALAPIYRLVMILDAAARREIARKEAEPANKGPRSRFRR